MDYFRESVFSEGLIEDFYGNFPRIHPPPTCYSAAGLLSHVLLSLSPCTCNVVFKQVNNSLFLFCFCFFVGIRVSISGAYSILRTLLGRQNEIKE